MKIDLGKVTSIQLTLAISVIPEDIAIVREELNKSAWEGSFKKIAFFDFGKNWRLQVKIAVWMAFQ